MNNYCTNCGNKLDKKDLKCNHCDTPIIYLPCRKKNNNLEKKVLIITLILIICISGVYLVNKSVSVIKSSKLKKKYVEIHLKENYPTEKFEIEYESFGRCIVSGDCFFDNGWNCDGGGCDEYEYLPLSQCKAYYYNIQSNNDKFIITVFFKDKNYSIVEGRNINGTCDSSYYDECHDSEEDDYDFYNNYNNYNYIER